MGSENMVVTSQNALGGGGEKSDFTDWLVIFTDCFFFSTISIMSVARVGQTATFTDRNWDFATYHVTIFILFI